MLQLQQVFTLLSICPESQIKPKSVGHFFTTSELVLFLCSKPGRALELCRGMLIKNALIASLQYRLVYNKGERAFCPQSLELDML